MADVSPVLKRLEVLTAILGRQPPETRIPVSDTQAQIVIDLPRGSRFAIGDLAQVAEAVAKSALTPVAAARVQECLASLLSGEVRPMPSRATLQQFENLHEFLTRAAWDGLAANDTSAMFADLGRLGLRHPSELTKQAMAVVLMLASKGLDGALTLPGELKTAMVKSAGQLFSRFCAELPPPAEWVSALPRTPAELRTAQPTTYNHAYAQAPPVPCPVDKLFLAELRRTTKMRQTRGNGAAMFGGSGWPIQAPLAPRGWQQAMPAAPPDCVALQILTPARLAMPPEMPAAPIHVPAVGPPGDARLQAAFAAVARPPPLLPPPATIVRLPLSQADKDTQQESAPPVLALGDKPSADDARVPHAIAASPAHALSSQKRKLSVAEAAANIQMAYAKRASAKGQAGPPKAAHPAKAAEAKVQGKPEAPRTGKRPAKPPLASKARTPLR